MNTTYSNLKYAARTLRKRPAFSLTVIVVLALGIGGNVGIFSIVNAVLLRPLPYERSDRLAVLWGNVQREVVERRGASLPDYRDWKNQNSSFDGLASFWDATFTLSGDEERIPIQGEVVGAEYFRVLRTKPVLGRDFLPQEETDSNLPAVIILGHELWAQRFGSDPSIIGTKLKLDSTLYTIVGVVERGFRGLSDGAEVWIPLGSMPQAQQNFNERGTRGFRVVGRLKDGISIVRAQSDMDNISRALERAYPDTNEKRGVEVAPLVEETVGRIRPALFVIFAAIGVVLLIACANVASLVILRTEARTAELAVRVAVGGSRTQILKLILHETFLLSAVGAALGLLLSSWIVDLLLAISPIQLPSFVNVSVDRTVILFVLALAFLTGIGMAIAPILQFAPSNLHELLNSNSPKTSSARSTRRFRNFLIVAEVALSCMLLFSAGLLIESFRQLLRVDTGFEPEGLLAFRLGLDRTSSTKPALIKEALEGLPGVKSVALSSVIPFTGGPAAFYAAEGEPPRLDATTAPRTYVSFVGPGYFRTMGIRLLHGRDFNAQEGEAVIVSEKVVQRFWPGQDPIGKRIRIGRNNSENPWLNIVGVVANTKTRGLPENPTPDPDIYFSIERYGGNVAVLVRADVDASRLMNTVREEIHRIDKLAIVSNVATLEELMRPSTARARFLSALTGIFSGMAWLLALVGVYGSVSYTVAERTREIGIRVALGADRRDVLRMVFARALPLLGTGIALGIIGGVLVSRQISTMLFGVGATAPSVFIIASALMLFTGSGAAFVPARRATEIDPLNALRQE